MFNVIKKNKRLYIISENGELLYTPPDFIHLHSRQPMIELAEQITDKETLIDHIMKFEKKYGPK